MAAGLRVLVISDSGHSGSVTRAAAAMGAPKSSDATPRFMPDEVMVRTYMARTDRGRWW